MHDDDLKFIRASVEIARRAREKDNHPFGALLVDDHGQILLEAENTVITTGDYTGHAEANLMMKAASKYDPEFLAKCTLYTSTEPCPMCAAIIFWGNVRRVVYGLGAKVLYELIGLDNEDVLDMPCRELFAKGNRAVEVIGPLLEEECREVHRGFWKAD